jgi:hypothetical protein
MTVDKAAIAAMVKDNLHNVFGSNSTETRQSELKRLWAPSGSILFTDPDFSKTTYEEIDTFVGNLQKGKEDWAFTDIGLSSSIFTVTLIANHKTNEKMRRSKWLTEI